MKKYKIIIMIGLPGSGKSTYTKKLVSENSNYIRINRDDIRYMLKNSGKTDYYIEYMINDIIVNIIKNAFLRGLTVVLDNTHVKLSFINSYLKKFNEIADFEYIEISTDLTTCIKRDKLRDTSVGEDVITKMYNDLNILKKTDFYKKLLIDNKISFV